MASQFLPIGKGYPGSASNAESVYPIVWNPLKGRTESDDPNFYGFTRSGVMNVPKGYTPAPAYAGSYSTTPIGVAAGSAPTPAPAAGLPGIFGINTGNSIDQRVVEVNREPTPVSAGASQVFPLNVPIGPGVSAISVPKDANVSAATDSMFSGFSQIRDSVNNVMADFKAKHPEWFKGQEATAAAENAVTGGLFDGAEQAKVNANVANFLTQANAANAKTLGDVHRFKSRALLASGAGASSAADRAELVTMANINAQAGKDAANAQISGDQWLTQLQNLMAGKQNERGRLLLTDMLAPALAETNQFDALTRILAQLANTKLSGTTSGVVGPGGFVGDTFGGLQMNMLNAANNSGGYQPIQMFPNGGIGPTQQRPVAQVPQPTVTNNWYGTFR